MVPYLLRHGEPIRYSYAGQRWPLEAYQTVFGRLPGSAEMPSAARPFSPAVVTDLVARGVTVAPITLHCGVSSLEAGEDPYPEQYDIPPGHRPPGQPDQAVRRPGDRDRHHRRPRPGDRRPGRLPIAAQAGWTPHVVTPGRACGSWTGC